MLSVKRWLGIALASLALACVPEEPGDDDCDTGDSATDLNVDVRLDLFVSDIGFDPIEGAAVDFTATKIPCGASLADSVGTSRSLSISGVTNEEGVWRSPYPLSFNMRNDLDTVYLTAEVTAEWQAGPTSRALAETTVAYWDSQRAPNGTYTWKTSVPLSTP